MLDFLWKWFLCALALISMARCEGIRTEAENGILHHTPISPHRQVRSQETVGGQSDPRKNVEKMAYEFLKDEKGAISRRKRSILFPSGVQLCAEETVQQAIANHLSYYHLRVCQETVWEAFKIFWDRLPDREEYYHWFSMCQEGTIGVFEIGSTFSQSEEHVALVHSRILTTSVKSHETTVPPTEQVTVTTQKDETISTLRPEMSLAAITPEVTPEATAEAEEGVSTEIPKSITTGITNDIELDTIAWPLLQQGEQVVELSIQLKGELYRDALRDSSSHDYQHLAQQFTEKIEDAFENLPGFTKVNILEFRQPEDARGMVVVHYAMTLEVGAGGISNETMDYINIQSNMVENSYLESNERPTVVYTISDIRSYITEALHKDSFMGNDTLTIDLDSLQLESVDSSLAQGAINPTTGPSNDDMDNVLASEKPPGMELTDNNIYISGIKKDDFLFDTAHPYEPWMGSQNAEAGENDVIILEVSPTLAPPEVPNETFDLNFEPIPKSEYSPLVLNTDGNGDIEADEFLVSSTVVTEATPTDSPGKDNVHLELGPEPTAAVIPVLPVTSLDNSLDMGSGSGISGDGPAADIWPWFSVMSGEELGGPGMERKSIGEEDPTSELDAELMEDGVEEFTEEPQILNVQDHKLEEYLDPMQTVSVEQEEEHEEDLIKDQTFLDRVLVTQNILMHPQYMTTEKPPVFWTMETLTVELSMQTEASGIYDDYYVNEASTIMMPVTDFPVAFDDPTTETPLLQRLTTTGQELTDSKHIEESLEEHETLPTTKPTSSTDIEAVLLQVSPATLAPTTNRPVSQPFIPESSDVDLDLETNFEQETIEAIEVEESLGTTTLSSEVSQPPTKFTTIDDVDSVKTEIALTNLPPFYQPTFRPTEKLFDIAVNSNEERNIKLELGVSVPTLTNETGDQMDPEHTITPEIENYALDAANITEPDILFDLFHYGGTAQTEEESSGYPSSFAHGTDMASVAMTANKGRALMVFFSLRVTNMMFSEDLFNKSSPEYKALEQRFLELLVPYLQSNLSNFQNLEILNFRNGSIVVNSRMKFAKPVPHGVTNSVYIILEEFCNTAYQTMNLAIDKYSLDVESGDRADPCKFQACNEFSLCMVNRWSGEAECVCNAGYFSVEGLPCQSICDLQHDFCLNDGKCDIIPGQGAICRCRVGENWWFRGAHCEEYVSEPLVVGIAIASVAGFLLVASAVIFFLARTMRDQYDKEDSEDPIRHEDSAPSLERATKYNPMYESDATTGYNHYYRRYPEAACYSSASAEASTDFSSEEIRHIYENSELTKEEIQDRIRIIELYAKDRQFADFMRQHQVAIDIRRDSSSTS